MIPYEVNKQSVKIGWRLLAIIDNVIVAKTPTFPEKGSYSTLFTRNAINHTLRFARELAEGKRRNLLLTITDQSCEFSFGQVGRAEFKGDMKRLVLSKESLRLLEELLKDGAKLFLQFDGTIRDLIKTLELARAELGGFAVPALTEAKDVINI